ncbi:amidophosphoribosyltransferase precursor [bacterium BMS3Abin14]|nr:amidophosphoribosyltransferase precursor [bacterium BMS3Abin14]
MNNQMLCSNDKFQDECGVFGVWGHTESANLTYLGLYALQHRGQECAGIAATDGVKIFRHGEMGLVNDIFTPSVLEKLPGKVAIGHNRYSTSGESLPENIQPIAVTYSRGGLAVAHNGNLVNAPYLKRELEENGAIFQSSSDTEVLIHLVARSKAPQVMDRVIEALYQVRGAYSLLFMTEKRIVAVRDPRGFRPLCIGRLGDAYVFSSESCALDLIEAEFVRDVEPGEVVTVDDSGMHSFFPFPKMKTSPCIFEYVYFARPDSTLDGKNVYMVRKNLGRLLAKEAPVQADVVIPVPDSGVPAAVGFSEGTGIPIEMGLIRNHYIGRTFIEPTQSIRHFGVKLKLNTCREAVMGKKVVLIDDSIVRGTTSRKIVKMVRDAGAAEVHIRISSPPTISPCYYGIDTPTHNELIASSHTVEEIRKYITADSLGYLSMKGMVESVGWDGPMDKAAFCRACFSGEYPVSFPRENTSQMSLWAPKISNV